MPDGSAEKGQGTVEWVALILLLALVLGAFLTLRQRAPDTDLGARVAARITCAAAGSCGGGRIAEPLPALGLAAPGAAVLGAALPGGLPPTAPGRRARAGRPVWLQGPSRVAAALRSGRAAAALRGLRRASSAVAKRAWLGCLAYGRHRWEREHPALLPRAMPPRDALAIANECINPFSFVGG
jgi:hypothetical protein